MPTPIQHRRNVFSIAHVRTRRAQYHAAIRRVHAPANNPVLIDIDVCTGERAPTAIAMFDVSLQSSRRFPRVICQPSIDCRFEKLITDTVNARRQCDLP